MIETLPVDTFHVIGRHLDFLIDVNLGCTTIAQVTRTDQMTLFEVIVTIATYPVDHED